MALPFTPQRSECFRSSTEVCGSRPSPAAAIRPTRLHAPHSTLMRSAGPRRSPFLIDADNQVAPDHVGAGDAQFLGRVELAQDQRVSLP